MEGFTLDQILQWLGPGPLAAIVVIAWFLLPIYRRHVSALEKGNILRRCTNRLLKANLEFLKKEGHDVQIPDLSEEI